MAYVDISKEEATTLHEELRYLCLRKSPIGTGYLPQSRQSKHVSVYMADGRVYFTLVNYSFIRKDLCKPNDVIRSIMSDSTYYTITPQANDFLRSKFGALWAIIKYKILLQDKENAETGE